MALWIPCESLLVLQDGMHLVVSLLSEAPPKTTCRLVFKSQCLWVKYLVALWISGLCLWFLSEILRVGPQESEDKPAWQVYSAFQEKQRQSG